MLKKKIQIEKINYFLFEKNKYSVINNHDYSDFSALKSIRIDKISFFKSKKSLFSFLESNNNLNFLKFPLKLNLFNSIKHLNNFLKLFNKKNITFIKVKNILFIKKKNYNRFFFGEQILTKLCNTVSNLKIINLENLNLCGKE